MRVRKLSDVFGGPQAAAPRKQSFIQHPPLDEVWRRFTVLPFCPRRHPAFFDEQKITAATITANRFRPNRPAAFKNVREAEPQGRFHAASIAYSTRKALFLFAGRQNNRLLA